MAAPRIIIMVVEAITVFMGSDCIPSRGLGFDSEI
jgi:hypothetical protein